MPLRFGCIVEGDGEKAALPVLLRRLHPRITVELLKVNRSSIVKPNEIERHVELLSRRVRPDGALLVLLDADDDPACQLGPELLHRVHITALHLPSAVILAEREYEAWFIGAAASLSNQRGLAPNLEPHPSPQTIRNAKGWLSVQMTGGKYNPVLHQAAFTSQMDLEGAAAQCPSFAKFVRDVQRLLSEPS